MARPPTQPCEINMTPMIDVVFQLIIFFIVTLKVTQDINEDIVLEDGKHGQTIKHDDPGRMQTLEIEVDRRGWISIHNARLSKSDLADIIRRRYNKFGSFPVLIRADQRTKHEDVKTVMDICTRIGVWKVGFVAIKDPAPKRR